MMIRLYFSIAVAALGLSAASLANDAFVPQISPDRSPADMQQQSRGGSVFVQQVPEHARPRPPAQSNGGSPAARTFVEQVFISPREIEVEIADGSEPLIVDDPIGIEPHAQGKLPSLPNVGAGSTVVVSTPGGSPNIPTVGNGVVML